MSKRAGNEHLRSPHALRGHGRRRLNSTRKAGDLLVQGIQMMKKTRHPEYARGYEKGHAEGKQVGFEEGRIKGREEILAQGDEAFVREYEQGRKEAYARGYDAGRLEKETTEFLRGYEKGREEGLVEGYKRYHDSHNRSDGSKRTARRQQRQRRDAAQLPFVWEDDE